MTEENKIVVGDDESTEELCEVCGSVKYFEDGKYVCPHCDGEINYFGEDDDRTAE